MPLIYAPVCCNKGTDDEEEYSNICEARCDILDIGLDGEGNKYGMEQCEPGKCEHDPGCICTEEWDPVCCGQTKTFGNQCSAQCDGYDDDDCTKGSCKDITICTMEYMPLCCDDKDYANPCLAEANGYTEPAEEDDRCEPYECKSQGICTMEYDPFCCDGTTYGNECMCRL